LKHIGRVANTGRRCVVVFREIYNEQGDVTDANSCLVVETESLPDHVHEDFMRIVESSAAQTTGNLYEVLARTRFSDGVVSLQYLHNYNRLHKHSTDNINLHPSASQIIKLSVVNQIIDLQKSGHSEADIERIIQDGRSVESKKDMYKEPAVSEYVEATVAKTDSSGVLSDADIANGLLSQADIMEAEVVRLRAEAYALVPTPKVTPKPRAKKKATVAKKSTTSASKD